MIGFCPGGRGPIGGPGIKVTPKLRSPLPSKLLSGVDALSVAHNYDTRKSTPYTNRKKLQPRFANSTQNTPRACITRAMEPRRKRHQFYLWKQNWKNGTQLSKRTPMMNKIFAKRPFSKTVPVKRYLAQVPRHQCWATDLKKVGHIVPSCDVKNSSPLSLLEGPRYDAVHD